MKIFRQLILNFGSTSTKFAVYEGETELFSETLRHSAEELAPYSDISEQLGFREQLILDALKARGIALDSFDAVVGRGGFVHPVCGGTIAVNDAVCSDLSSGRYGKHASNLGGLIAKRIADKTGKPAFIVDPVVVDELDDIAKVTGHPLLVKRAVWHALNQKAVAKGYAKQLGRPYEELNLIVAHIGGGCSVGAHKRGRVVDVNNALDGDGPFSPERPGTLPVGPMISLCWSGKFKSESDMKREFTSRSGLVAYLGTNDGREVTKRIEGGDAYAKLIYDAMAYQIAKEIGAAAVVLAGDVDAILLTGGLAHDSKLMAQIIERVGFISKVAVVPGEDELGALALGGLRVLNGEEKVISYDA